MNPPIRYEERVVELLWQRQAALSVGTFQELQRAIVLSPALTTFADITARGVLRPAFTSAEDS